MGGEEEEVFDGNIGHEIPNISSSRTGGNVNLPRQGSEAAVTGGIPRGWPATVMVDNGSFNRERHRRDSQTAAVLLDDVDCAMTAAALRSDQGKCSLTFDRERERDEFGGSGDGETRRVVAPWRRELQMQQRAAKADCDGDGLTAGTR